MNIFGLNLFVDCQGNIFLSTKILSQLYIWFVQFVIISEGSDPSKHTKNHFTSTLAMTFTFNAAVINPVISWSSSLGIFTTFDVNSVQLS